MNISQEKEYIYKLMREITEERRVLTNLYYDLHKRMADLNKLEETGLTDLSIEGYADLHNKMNKNLIISNQQREAMQIFAESRKEVEEQPVQEKPVEEKRIIPLEEIDRVKQLDKKSKVKVSKPKKRKRIVERKKAVIILKHILLEEGVPVEKKKLYQLFLKHLEVGQQDFTYHNFSYNLLPRVQEIDPNIQIINGNMYQYVSRG